MTSPLQRRTGTALLADRRRRAIVIGAGAGSALAALAVPRLGRAQAATKIRIGFWPVAAGLPFFAAVEKGYFKEAGLDVEALKFAGAQQVMEAMLSGRADGSAKFMNVKQFLANCPTSTQYIVPSYGGGWQCGPVDGSRTISSAPTWSEEWPMWALGR